MDFPQILTELMRYKGVTSYRIGKDTGISPRLIDYWRKGEKLPGAENLQRIADYFHVSVDFLLGNEKKEAPSLSEDAVSSPYVKELIRLVDSASPEKQKQALDLIKVLLQEEGRESGQV